MQIEPFFVALICSYQAFSGNACNTIAGAYFEKVSGQKVLDAANHKYIDPLPVEVKDAGIATYGLYTKRIHFNLHRGLGLDVRVDRWNTVDNKVESTLNVLTYSRSFP